MEILEIKNKGNVEILGIKVGEDMVILRIGGYGLGRI